MRSYLSDYASLRAVAASSLKSNFLNTSWKRERQVIIISQDMRSYLSDYASLRAVAASSLKSNFLKHFLEAGKTSYHYISRHAELFVRLCITESGGCLESKEQFSKTLLGRVMNQTESTLLIVWCITE
uniref:uncharacterized protein LOC120337350 n=1 Tax=Styela clava TaxID=7725 RepID=UPI00193AA09A|nr:uncharacterized protein LOC120337350 [Styela clava]